MQLIPSKLRDIFALGNAHGKFGTFQWPTRTAETLAYFACQIHNITPTLIEIVKYVPTERVTRVVSQACISDVGYIDKMIEM